MAPEQASVGASAGYWSRIAAARLTRRRALAIGVSAVGLAAIDCGGNGSSGSSGAGSKLQMFTKTAEEGPAKRGGTWTKTVTQEPPNLDPFRQAANETYTEVYPILSHLVRYGTGPKFRPEDLSIAPDLAEGWEVSDGGLTFTFKLRKDMKFHNIPPVNGRVVDASDVSYSFNRLKAATIYAQTLGTLSPTLTTPDANTVVMKVASPNVGFWNLLVEPRTLFIMPREGDGGYDAGRTAIGSGPWMLTDHVVSSRFSYKRNPDYFEKNIPYMDGIDSYILSEPAQLLSQFRAGTLLTLQPSATDAAQLLEFNPKFRLMEAFSFPGYGLVAFQRGDPSSPPLKDVRLRQAISMLIDRGAVYEAMGQLDVWRKMGIDRSAALDNYIPRAFGKWWTDPRGKEMGDSAKYFSYDVAEAKKLMAAAGFATGWTADYHTTPTFIAQPYLNTSEAVAGMLEAAGINLRRVSDDYNSVYQPKTQVGLNTGLQFGSGFSFNDPSVGLDNFFAPDGQRNHMAVNDPIYNDLMAKQRVTFDDNERRKIFIQIQQHLAKEERTVVVTYRVPVVSLSWPHVRNNYAYRGFNEYDSTAYYWLDK